MALAPGTLQFSSQLNPQTVDITQFKCSEHLKNQYVYFCLSCNFILIKKIVRNPFVFNARKLILFNTKIKGQTKNMSRFHNI
jgi:hypothetical protein